MNRKININDSYIVARISANFLKNFGLKSFNKPSLVASVILLRLTRYVDVDFKIQIDFEALYSEMGIRSDVFYAAIDSLIKRGYILKKFDGYYVTEKSHVIIREGSDELFAPNLEILSNYNTLGLLKPKTVNFLYYLIGNTVSPNAKYTRTYQVCSLYTNKFKKENVGFNLFNSLKELLSSIISLASNGLIEARFKNKVTKQEFLVQKALLNENDELSLMKSILKFFGYSINESEKLVKNNNIQHFNVVIKVLVDSEKFYQNTANFMEFKNELATYGLAAENIFSLEDDFSYENNEINLFISIKNRLIQVIGHVLGTQIYRDALRYFLSEKHDRLFAYHLSGTGKAVNIFKKYYLMPYLEHLLFSTLERFKLEGEFTFDNPMIPVATYNTSITHEQFNGLINWITEGDLTTLAKICEKLFVHKEIKEKLFKQYPAFRKLTVNYQDKINKYYKKYVMEAHIQMDITKFEMEIKKIVEILDRQAAITFENVLDKFMKSYANYADIELLQSEVKKYEQQVAIMKKNVIQNKIKYALQGHSSIFDQHIPKILDEVLKEFVDDIPTEKLINMTDTQEHLLIEKAKISFEAKLKAITNMKDSKQFSKNHLWYNWIEIRE